MTDLEILKRDIDRNEATLNTLNEEWRSGSRSLLGCFGIILVIVVGLSLVIGHERLDLTSTDEDGHSCAIEVRDELWHPCRAKVTCDSMVVYEDIGKCDWFLNQHPHKVQLDSDQHLEFWDHAAPGFILTETKGILRTGKRDGTKTFVIARHAP